MAPAYGSWVVDFGTFSEVLGSFGGGLPTMRAHGTNQPELIGSRVSSGSLRLENNALDEFVAIEGLIGAPVHLHERPQQLASHGQTLFRPTRAATTQEWTPNAQRLLSS